jgi:hypothetical protein
MAQNIATLTKDVFSQGTTILPAAAGTLVTILTADTVNDRQLTVAQVASTDTAAQSLTLYANDGTNDYQLGLTTVTINAGNVSGTPAIDLRGILQALVVERSLSGVAYYNLKKGWSLKAKVTAITAAKQFDFIVSGGIYN